MGWASEQFRNDLGLGQPDYTGDGKGKLDNKKKEESLPKVDKNIKCIQAVVVWKFFDKRISLEQTIDILIGDGYHVDNITPIASYLKQGGSTILITEALIIVSQ